MDSITYDKRAQYHPGHGFEVRVRTPSSIVVHSTSNPRVKNTPFSSEATFLYNSTLVSAHYLVGKDGHTVCFLDPSKWAAWHAGNARVEFENERSIGIELHHSVGDPPYPKAQLEALTVLLRSLMGMFDIPVDRIETHGQIALPGPYIRKKDPSDMSYQAFLQVRSTLVSDPPPVSPPPTLAKKYRVRGAAVYHAESGVGSVAGYLAPGDEVFIDKTYPSGTGHIADSTPKYGGLGFIRLSEIEAVTQ